jgi:hypothetical protein
MLGKNTNRAEACENFIRAEHFFDAERHFSEETWHFFEEIRHITGKMQSLLKRKFHRDRNKNLP